MKRTVLALITALLAASATAGVAAPHPASPPAFDAAIDRAKGSMMADPQAALTASRQALALAKDGSSAQAMRTATAQWLEAQALMRTGHVKEALPIINDALKVAATQAPRDRLHAELTISEGDAMSIQGDVQRALEDYQAAFDLYGAAGYPRGQAKALQNIGSIYQDARDYERVLKYYAQSAETYKADPVLLVSALNNKADAYRELGRYNEAIAAFKSAIAVARRMDSASLEASILSNLARAEVKAGKLADADADVRRAPDC